MHILPYEGFNHLTMNVRAYFSAFMRFAAGLLSFALLQLSLYYLQQEALITQFAKGLCYGFFIIPSILTPWRRRRRYR